ncbi:hypothetical protein L7F22_017025 [Adiantum nelumboides]|nr:hypothetical protein [Adiantum nelumboides]
MPKDVKEVVTRLHLDAKNDGKDPNAYLDALVDDLGGDASLSQGGASGSTSTHASGGAHVSATGTSASKSNVRSSSKKRKVAQGPLASAFSLQARKQADQALLRVFYAEDILEWKVQSPFFLEMVKAIGQVGPSYVPPTYNALHTIGLNDEVKCIDVYLTGTVMLIFGMGLYGLFISNVATNLPPKEDRALQNSSLFGMFFLQERPKWMRIASLDELKTKLGHVVVMILLVKMFERSKAVVIATGADLLSYSVSIFLTSGALLVLRHLHH